MSLLRMENVRKTYRSGMAGQIVVLRDVSLTLEAGECMAVWGARGSGKTTLLKLAAGLLRPQAGSVRLGGCRLGGEGLDGEGLGGGGCGAGAPHLDGRVGWVRGGGPQMQALEVLDCVALPLLGGGRTLRSARTQAAEALDCVGLAERARTRWDRLSVFERVLASVARALAHRPLLLVADDPLVALASDEREPVMRVLRGLAEERSLGVIVSVSEIVSMVHAHRVSSLSDGQLLVPRTVEPVAGNVLQLRPRRYAIG